MNQSDPKIDPTKKVKLLFEAGRKPGIRDLTEVPQTFEFVFGIGTQGLIPFEYLLTDKSEQEEIEVTLRIEKMTEFFQHLLPLPFNIPDQIETLYIKVKIISITTADPREVVRAMAEVAACGDHDCGQ